jgi:photosystem II stability/assembly factor-like uncharacterized protein
MLIVVLRDCVHVTLMAFCVGLSASGAMAQTPSWTQHAKQLTTRPDLQGNTVNELAPAGDSLWLAPGFLGLAGTEAIARPDLGRGDRFVFSIAARNASTRRVWAGLAFDVGGGELGADGFLVSTDGGTTFTERDPQLDVPDDPGATTISYGGNVLEAIPITEQASSVPQDLAFGPGTDTVWVAGMRSGLRWTTDQGRSWHRAVLPPDSTASVAPSNANDFLVSPPLSDGRGWRNHVVFQVLVDEEGTVWAGTPEGVNRSRNGTVTANGRRAWDRFDADGTDGALPADFVVALTEQSLAGRRNPVWVATQPVQAEQRFGVAVTEDGGATFQKTLIGESISDIATRQARVYAVGPAGLYVTADQGDTWRTVEAFPLKNDNKILPDDVTPLTVATTDAALWVGTDEGLLRLDRADEPSLLGSTPEWGLLRAKTPVNPESPTDEAPDVSTYAYPNPFVPSQDQFVRIVYELDTPGTVEVNIYDFGMNRVRTITDQRPDGQQETVWRGTNDQGLRVPTGTYFYTVDLGGRTVKGKILVAN